MTRSGDNANHPTRGLRAGVPPAYDDGPTATAGTIRPGRGAARPVRSGAAHTDRFRAEVPFPVEIALKSIFRF